MCMGACSKFRKSLGGCLHGGGRFLGILWYLCTVNVLLRKPETGLCPFCGSPNNVIFAWKRLRYLFKLFLHTPTQYEVSCMHGPYL